MSASYRDSISMLSLFAIAAFVAVALAQPAFGQCGELVVNGDFESGNTGFTSQYIYSPGNLLPEGTYDVLANPNLDHPCFGGVDHTTGSGNLMAVNGSVNAGRIVWSQTVAVLVGTNYALSAWVNSHCGAGSPAVLSFRVNGVAVGAPYPAPATVFPWAQFTGTWNSGVSTSALIEIIDLNTAAGGNDFGLDDISFMKIDETGPSIVCTGGHSMWPPNHEYQTFTLSQLVSSVTDDCDANPEVFIRSVGSDEPEDAPNLGDGETLDDIVIAEDCQSVMLRAERQGNSNGRVYTIYVSAIDLSGNITTEPCMVTVNHDRYVPAIDDGVGAGYLVSSACGLAKQSTPVSAPLQFALEQNYPNPFNPSTEIAFSIQTETYVKLAVYDHLGREVAVLSEGTKLPGAYAVTFDAAGLPSGLYMYRLDTPQGSKAMKMLLTK